MSLVTCPMRAADIQPMRHAAGKGDQPPLVKDRFRQRDVVKMAAGRVGIVSDVDVTRLDTVHAEMADLRLDGLRHSTDEHRQAKADRDRLARWREQPDGEVQRLVDDHVVGGAHEIGLHLFGHRQHAIANDFDGDRINRIALLDRRLLHRGMHGLFSTDTDVEIAELVD